MDFRKYNKSLWSGIMTYQVFNQLTGQYTSCERIETAKQTRNNFINDYFVNQGMYQGVRFNNPSESDKAIANEFVAIKLGISEVTYFYTVYNATTKTIISRVFECSEGGINYLIKVSSGQVTEWYKANTEFNGSVKLFVALDVNTDEVIEYYETQAGVVTKYSTDGTPIVTTIWCGYDAIPTDKKQLLADFSFKDTIQAYSDKSYGFCVEFSEAKFTNYEFCTQEEKNLLDTQKQNFTKTTDLFPVNQEILHENGDVTWVLVDTTTW